MFQLEKLDAVQNTINLMEQKAAWDTPWVFPTGFQSQRCEKSLSKIA